jgi:hypothetical protein
MKGTRRHFCPYSRSVKVPIFLRGSLAVVLPRLKARLGALCEEGAPRHFRCLARVPEYVAAVAAEVHAPGREPG